MESGSVENKGVGSRNQSADTQHHSQKFQNNFKGQIYSMYVWKFKFPILDKATDNKDDQGMLSNKNHYSDNDNIRLIMPLRHSPPPPPRL